MTSKILTLLLAAAPAVLAQNSAGPDPIKTALEKHWKTAGQFTLAVAQAMPADQYNFRPVPEEMTFGQLMAHIGAADFSACAIAGSVKRPDDPPKIAAWRKDNKLDIDKDTVVEYLTAAFAFCDQQVAAISPQQANTVLGPAARNLTGFEWLWAYFTHTAHHRGQAEVYLRLKGIKPPDYQF